MKAWVAAAVSIAIAASIAVAPSASADQGSVDGTQPVLAMAAYTTCAIRESGQVYCWGNNENGELGRGNTAPSPYVAPVSGLTAAIGIYGDVWAFCALLEDRTVRCWGYGGSGTLGDGLGTSSFVPVTVSGLNHVTSVAIGYGAACATKQDGSVWCWGAGNSGIPGALGGGKALVPVKKAGISSAVAVSVSGYHACALKVDHSVWCWGRDASGELGNGEPYADNATPTKVRSISDAVAITAGEVHSCAVRAGGTAVCWGQNGRGELGSGGYLANSPSPLPVRRLTGVTRIAGGRLATCAIARAETMCWGSNDYWQLGDSTVYSQTAPVLATAADTNGRGIDIGTTTTCQVTPARYVWCWGANGDGEAGISSPSGLPNGGGPGYAFGRTDTPTKVRILNSATGKPIASSSSAHRIKVWWAAPSTSNGTSAPKDYVIKYRLKGTTTWKTFKDAVSTARSATVTGLTSGKYYQFRVYPKNWAGTGTVSAASGYIKSK